MIEVTIRDKIVMDCVRTALPSTSTAVDMIALPFKKGKERHHEKFVTYVSLLAAQVICFLPSMLQKRIGEY